MIITVSLLAKIFIRERGEFSSQSVRSAYGKLCGICGIILNLLLLAAKAAVGSLCLDKLMVIPAGIPPHKELCSGTAGNEHIDAQDKPGV